MNEPIAIVDDERFDAHRQQQGQHPECPERLIAAREGLYAGLGDCPRVHIPTRLAEPSELQRVHSASYLRALQTQLRAGAGLLNPDTFFCSGTEEATWRAAGGGIALVDALLRAEGPRRGVALLRPPGHHAEADRSMGFCLLNHVAVAATAARSAGASRVAIVDFDVHHGNGTQQAFYHDADVLFVSLHQSPFYPGTGRPQEVGTGPGVGRTINIALPAGSDSAAYSTAFNNLVIPSLNRFQPDLIVVSAGFDAHVRDPLADMRLETTAYHALVSALITAADQLCAGRIAFFLEGGYDLPALRDCMERVGRALQDQHVALDEGKPSHQALSALAQTAQHLLDTKAMKSPRAPESSDDH